MNKSSSEHMLTKHHMDIHYIGGWSYRRNSRAIVKEMENDKKLKGIFTIKSYKEKGKSGKFDVSLY